MLDIKFVRANPDAVKENMSTNMTPEEMSAIIKMQLADMPDWKIKRQAIKGTNAFEYCYALGFSLDLDGGREHTNFVCGKRAAKIDLGCAGHLFARRAGSLYCRPAKARAFDLRKRDSAGRRRTAWKDQRQLAGGIARQIFGSCLRHRRRFVTGTGGPEHSAWRYGRQRLFASE